MDKNIKVLIVDDLIAHMADDQRHIGHSDQLEFVQNVPQNRFAGDVDEHLGLGMRMGAQSRSLTRDRNDGFQHGTTLQTKKSALESAQLLKLTDTSG